MPQFDVPEFPGGNGGRSRLTTLPVGEYATWDALRAALGRAIESHPTAKKNAAGNIDCRGVCHDGAGDSGLFYSVSSNTAVCNTGCPQERILDAFGLPEKPARHDPVPARPAVDRVETTQPPDAEPEPTTGEYVSLTAADSFVSRYVDYARRRTDAPAEAHELMACGVLSALAGPKPRVPIATEVRGWPLTLWVIYIVDSTTGRKSSTLNYASDIIVEILGRDATILWEGSPQAILQRLAEQDGKASCFIRDEYSGLLAGMNRGGHMAGLAQNFIKAFDGHAVENNRTKKRNKASGEIEDDTDRAEMPYLTKLCASTWDAFVSRATLENVLDGLLARFIVYTGSAKPRRMTQATPELLAQRESLLQHARQFYRKCTYDGAGPLEIDEDVLDAAWELEQALLTKAADTSRPDAAGPALKRLSDNVLKVAALMAIDSAEFGEVPRVALEHFEPARLLGLRWVNSTVKLVDAIGRTGFQRDCDGVLTTIRTSRDGMRIRDVYRKHRRLKNRDFNEVLTALQNQDEITIAEGESASGPAARIVRATRGGK